MNYIYSKLCNKLGKQITIFSIPKPFCGHIGVIQYNAIFSWTLLTPKPEIILFGDELGMREICQKFNLIHIPEVQRNKYGTPLLNSIFVEIHHRASNDIVAYLNADIILTNDFYFGIQSVSQELDDYLLIGRRWNVEIKQKLIFNPGWESSLDKLIREKGCLADYDCKDYFVFPKHLFTEIPSFAVGRGYWDTWMVRKSLENSYPVVDGSLLITAIHQDHSYTHIRGGRNEAYMGREAQINKTMGNVTKPGDIACATWQLKPVEYRHLPTISIVMVVDDESANLEKALLSILIQDYQDYEIIVVDHRSDNEIKEILQPYKDKINYYRSEKQEIATAYNYALEMAQGEFVTFLNSRSILLPGALGKQVTCFEKEASTLDILLSGYRTMEGEKVIEYKPWTNLPDLQNVHSGNLVLFKELTRECVIVFRLSRFKLVQDAITSRNQKLYQVDNILCQILAKGCRASWLKSTTQINFDRWE